MWANLFKMILFFLIVCLNMIANKASSQSRDTIKSVANNHKQFFIDCISKYFPLSNDDIYDHKDILNFRVLSENENIKWTNALIEKYSAKWSYSNLCLNRNINWNSDLIVAQLKKIKNYGRQLVIARDIILPVDLVSYFGYSDTLSYKVINISKDSVIVKYLPIGQLELPQNNQVRDFLHDHYSVGIDKKKVLDSLIYYFGEAKIGDIAFDFIVENMEFFNKYSLASAYPFKSLPEVDLIFMPNMLQSLIYNKKFISDQIISKIDEDFIKSIFDQYRLDQSLISIKFNSDYEFTPSVIPKSPFGEQNIDINQLFKIRDFYFKYHYGYFSEYKNIHPIYNSLTHSTFLVDSTMKDLLNHFTIPEHKFYPVKLHSNYHWWGNETRDYFLFKMDNIQFSDLKNEKTIISNNGFYTSSERKIFDSELENGKNKPFNFYINSEIGNHQIISSIEMNSYYDLLSDGYHLFISPLLHKCLINNYIEGLYYSLIDKPYKINNPEFEKRDCPLLVNRKITDQAKIRFNQIKDSIETLFIKSDFGEYCKAHSYPNLSKFELSNELILPKEYLSFIQKDKFQQLQILKTEYTLIKFYDLNVFSQDWYENIPFLRKGVKIAENGLGDYLVLLLKKDNAFELSDMVYKYEHERGELIPYLPLR
jgi:hypothetical protein